MRFSYLLPAIAAATTVVAQDVGIDDVPSQCQSACRGVIALSLRCEQQTRGDSAFLQCACTAPEATEIGSCEACVNVYDNDNEVNKLRRACNLPAPAGQPSGPPAPSGPRGNDPRPAPTGGPGGPGNPGTPPPPGIGGGGVGGGPSPLPVGAATPVGGVPPGAATPIGGMPPAAGTPIGAPSDPAAPAATPPPPGTGAGNGGGVVSGVPAFSSGVAGATPPLVSGYGTFTSAVAGVPSAASSGVATFLGGAQPVAPRPIGALAAALLGLANFL